MVEFARKCEIDYDEQTMQIIKPDASYGCKELEAKML